MRIIGTNELEEVQWERDGLKARVEELSKWKDLAIVAEKESHSKLQSLQLIAEKEERGDNIEMLAGGARETSSSSEQQQYTNDLLEELEGVRASLVESTAEREELSAAKSAMQQEIHSLRAAAAKEAEMKRLLRKELESQNETTDVRQELSSAVDGSFQQQQIEILQREFSQMTAMKEAEVGNLQSELTLMKKHLAMPKK